MNRRSKNPIGSITTTTSTQYLLDLNTSLPQVMAEFSFTATNVPLEQMWYLPGIGQEQVNAVSLVDSFGWSYYGMDGLGSLRQMTDSAGIPQYLTSYDPFGSPFETYNALPEPSLGFTGQMTDDNGLQYLRARYYDPSVGMFTSRDPVMGVAGGSSITFNPYIYAGANPTNYVDPSGEFIGLIPFVIAALPYITMAGTALMVGLPTIAIINSARSQIYHAQMTSEITFGGSPSSLSRLRRPNFLQALGRVNWVDVSAAGLSAFGGEENVITSVPLFELGMTALDDVVASVDDDVSRALRAGGDCNSFSADTTVATSDGDVAIFEIEIGDDVLAYNEETGETGDYTVTDTISHVDQEIVLLTISGETLETTADHPFYTLSGEWVDAADLRVGDLIRDLNGSYGEVTSMQIVEREQPMFNLTVDEAHTFFVGDGQWLVHNDNPKCFVPTYALGNIGDARDTRLLNHATLQLYQPNGQTFFSGVYHLDTGRWLAFPSGNTKLASGRSLPESVLVDRRGGHRQVWHHWTKIDPFIPQRWGPNEWDPPFEGGLVGFTLPYRYSDQFPIRFRSFSINTSSWGLQEAPDRLKVFKNYLVRAGELVRPRLQVINALEGDLGLPIYYISNSLDG